MHVRTVPFEGLTSDEIAAWSTIQREVPHLASPFFRPEFTEAVAAVRNNVEVAVLEEDGRPIGFFPFQRSRWNTGGPVGGKLSDFHGLIAPASVNYDPFELLCDCRLTAWHFDNMLSDHASFTPFIWHETESPYIDLADGFEAYIAQKENGRSIRSKYGQKKRKFARELGPVRYEAHVSDSAIISTLIEWKREQYRRTRVPSILDYSWAREVLYKLLERQSEEFSSAVSVLYAGDTVASVNVGMRSFAVLNPMIPAYNFALARYSPGYIHWMEMIKAAESLGIRRIDLGKGDEPYKWRLMNGVTKVAEGVVDLHPGTAMIGRVWCHMRMRVRKSPLAAAVRFPVQMARRVGHWADCTIARRYDNT